MKDIHNHILFGIDDGSDNIDESIHLIKNAINGGYTDLVLTPHYRKFQGYTCDNKTKEEIFNKLKEEVRKQNLNINLYLGNEITIDEDIFYNLEVETVTSLNKSKYLLIELPFHQEFKNLKEYIYDLMAKGYRVIIVHPERYHYYKNLKTYEELINMGVLFQGNFGSLYGKWGSKSKKVLESMLKRHMIHFLGSDIHHASEQTFSKLNSLIPLIEALTMDRKMVRDITDLNIEKVIKNEDIKAYPVLDNDNWLEKIFKNEK